MLKEPLTFGEELFRKLLRLPGYRRAGVAVLRTAPYRAVLLTMFQQLTFLLSSGQHLPYKFVFFCAFVGRKTHKSLILRVSGFIWGFSVVFLPRPLYVF